MDRCKIVIYLIFGMGIIAGCNRKSGVKNNKSESSNAERIAALKGKKLVNRYCSSCHMPVTANYLDKKTWLNYVLPAMARKVGIGVYKRKQYYPKKGSIIPISKWLKIVAYFKNEAPDTLTVPEDTVALRDSTSSLFMIKKPQWHAKPHNIATTTLVSYNTLNHKLYTSDATGNKVYSWDENLEPTLLQKLSIAGVHANFYKDSLGDVHGVFTAIGNLKQINDSTGKLVDINLRTGSKRIIAKRLTRPVSAAPGDFNNDGLKDWIVCAFGHTVGGLYLYEQQPGFTFNKKVIREIPGAEEAVTGDFNHDGWLDVMVLFAQAKEGIWLFINNKRGGFKQRALLRFLPVYGSTSFQIIDFNKDGKPDILYTAGDNGDYSRILKPYHGIYIFMNEGGYEYKKVYFHHINGTTKAVAADFDNDDDLDIATISFFADLEGNSSTSFIYFEQDKPMHFILSTPASLHKLGRWISMDVADIDGDDDLDIMLGNFSRGFTTGKAINASWNTHLPFVILKNKTEN